jgi:hypothetical protein
LNTFNRTVLTCVGVVGVEIEIGASFSTAVRSPSGKSSPEGVKRGCWRMPNVRWLMAGTCPLMWAAMPNTDTGSAAPPLGQVGHQPCTHLEGGDQLAGSRVPQLERLVFAARGQELARQSGSYRVGAAGPELRHAADGRNHTAGPCLAYAMPNVQG